MPIPIADENPTHKDHKSHITLWLIIINVTVFFIFQIDLSNLWRDGLSVMVSDKSIIGFGLIPSVFWGDKVLPNDIFAIPSDFSLLSYMFLHGGLMHLISNMLILWVFGDNIEQALGKFRYLLFYILGGVAAGLLHAIIMSATDGPLIGASGAVSAIGAAYLLFHPRSHIWLLLFWFIPIKIPAWAAIGAWFAYQIYESALGSDQTVAWWAHIGGFVFGIVYIIWFNRALISTDFNRLLNRGSKNNPR